jgi:ribosomal protein S18 acetylase RimI-like enzyme
MADLEAVVRADLAMVTEELGFDPFTAELEAYREGWKRRVREGRVSVVGPLGGPLWFKAEQSAVSEDAVQVSGVFTDPTRRRQGIARASMAGMCRAILGDVPRIVLHVHHSNPGALRLYETLGFERVGSVRSVWFAPPPDRLPSTAPSSGCQGPHRTPLGAEIKARSRAARKGTCKPGR